MTKKIANKLALALKKEFGAKVEMEDVNGKGRYRFGVLSKQFSGMRHLKRQDEIWKVAENVLSRDELMDVSLIIAYSPDELVPTE